MPDRKHNSREQQTAIHSDIAIIGLGCRFPGAKNPVEFWNLLSQGVSVFEPFPAERSRRHAICDESGIKGAFIKDPYWFDNQYFNIPDAEALLLDPQQRMMLELAIETMEAAGFQDLKNQRAAVFIGANQMAYEEMVTSRWYREKTVEYIRALRSFQEIPEQYRTVLMAELDGLLVSDKLPPNTLVGNLINMIASRVSHELNITGPSMTIDTACSSSLVAVHLACESLLRQECDLAFAGGVNLNLTPSVFKYMEAAGVISPSGNSIPFSMDSDGILLGEGAGMILLKRLEEALEHQNPIFGVIRGSGMNNDGRSLSVMAPSWKGQLSLLQHTYQKSGVDPGRVGAIEAHGTSTRIGDSIELSVIDRFFPTAGRQISVGSVKSNIGHALGAAGIAGLIKMVLAMHHKQLPPSLHKSPNPTWKLGEKGIHIQSDLADWQSVGPRVAGISSFGFGGTNAHVILEESPVPLQVLPTPKTVFSRKHFYFDFFPQAGKSNDQLFVTDWRSTGAFEPIRTFQPTHWVLFCQHEKDRIILQKRFEANGWPCSIVLENKQTAKAFTRTDEYVFSLDPGNPDHYRWLLASIPPGESLGVLYLANRSTELLDDPEKLIHHELSAIKCLFQAAQKRNAETKIWVATFDAYQVKPGDTVSPAQRAMATLTGGAFAENESLRGGLVDLSSDEPDFDQLVFNGLGCMAKAPWVLRAHQLFEPILQPVAAAVSASRPMPVKPGGVYLMIGASSGVGAQIAIHLAQKTGVKVIVTGSRKPEALPDALKALVPTRIEYIQSSALSEEAQRRLIETVMDRYGTIAGIIYAAGSIAYGSLVQKNAAAFQDTLRVKILGVNYLHKAIQGKQIGFVYLIGSVSGLSPNWSKAMAEYGAANAYLEGFASARKNTSTQWMSCSWGIWENTGMAAGITNAAQKAPQALSVEDALACFEASLSLGLTNVVAMPAQSRDGFSFSWMAQTAVAPDVQSNIPASVGVDSAATPPVPSVVIETPATASPGAAVPDYRTFLLQLLAENLELPLEKIDEKESFYNLGLDSLSAVDVVKKFEEMAGLSLNPTLLFEYDSVEALTAYIHQLVVIPEKPVLPVDHAIDIQEQAVGNLPLLPSQQTFYANQVYYSDAPCNILVRLDSDKLFDRELLQTVWSTLIRKHDSLRIGFQMADHGPVQSTHEVQPSMEFYPFRNQHADALQVVALEEALVNHIFTLEQPPLYRFCYLAFDSGHSSLILVIHHIISDAWSVNLLLKELLEGYQLLENGKPFSALPAVPSFADYVAFAEVQYEKTDRTATVRYWEKALERAPAQISLPYRSGAADLVGQNAYQHSYQSIFWEATIDSTQLLLSTAKKWNATPFHMLLAAYFMLLNRLSKQADLVVRVASANREQPFKGIERLVGCLADSIPLRIQIGPEDDLETVVRKVRDTLLEAQKHGALSSRDFMTLQPERQMSGPSGFSPAGISFIPFDHLSKDLDHPFSDIRCRTALTFTDISLICALVGGKLSCSWNFSLLQFDPQTITSISAEYGDILLEMANPNGVAAHQPAIFPALEMPRVQLFPEKGLLHEKVWEACRMYPERIAISTGGTRVTYTELQQHSYRVANTLLEQVDPAQQVAGILAYPGTHAVYGILGILASGRAFIPFDPDWPDGRIESMIAHAQLKVMLTTEAFFHRLCDSQRILEQLETIVLIDGGGAVSNPPGLRVLTCSKADTLHLLPLPAPVTPDDLAYIMYTSGTSGKAKGVMVQHKAVEVFLNWISEAFAIGEEDRFIHSSSLGFGGSIRQIFSTLLAGATIYPITRYELKDPQSLLNFLEANEITILNTVPTVLHNLLEWLEYSPQEIKLGRLRLMLIGGEALFAETVARWRARFGASHRIVNLYGSTETIVNATIYTVDPSANQKAGVIPLGYQKKGSLVRLLNDAGVLCRPNEPGELYVGGPSIAKGYYRQADLSSERFVSLDHLGMEGVFYRTGDLARADATGLLHFLGRNDDQIQVYGNRVELLEIEDAIYQTKRVKSVAVVDFKDEQNHWLIAFVALNKSELNTTAREVRDFVAEKLPGYMVPHKVIILDKIPLNHAGKTDRVALRKQFAADFSRQPENAGLNKSEERVMAVWKEALRTEDIGPEDDFFALGGDSILALKVLHQLRKHFRVIPKPVVLFRDRTVRALARALDQLNADDQTEARSNTMTATAATKMPLSAAQKGFVLIQKLSPDTSPNWAALIQLDGAVDHPALQQAFDYLLNRHPMLRTVFVAEGLHTWQNILTDVSLPIGYLDSTAQTPKEQTATLRREFEAMKHTLFDLALFPHLQIKLIQTATDRGVIALCMHHIIGDAWSLNLLTNELLQVYDQLLQGHTPTLEPVPATYMEVIDYQISHEKTLTAARLEARRAFWTKTMAGVPSWTVVEKNAAVAETAADTFSVLLPESVKLQLKAVSKKHHSTLFHVMLTVFARSLGKLLETDDLLVGVPVSGREAPITGIQSIVGCFARNLPLRLQVSANTDFEVTLRSVEKVFLDALDHQDISPREFFKIVSDSGQASIFSANRFFFSFMDFSALIAYRGKHFSIDWDRSEIYFNTEGAAMELMLGVRVADTLLVNIHGSASLAVKARMKQLLLEELDQIISNDAPRLTEAKSADSIDTALIAYLPGFSRLEKMLPAHLEQKAWLLPLLRNILPDGAPRMLEITSTPFGNSGLVFLPMDADALSALSQEQLTLEITKAVRLAHAHGARHVALAGMLPSRTNYGFAIQQSLREMEDCVLTTGHSCTVVAVVKTIEKVLQALPVELRQLNIAVLGFGSIGQASLSLLLSVLGQPASIVIADLARQLPLLEKPLSALQERYAGNLCIRPVTGAKVPEEVYEADLIIGASSAGNLLDVRKIRPGTILVDDSFPSIIPFQSGIERMKTARDVLLLGGGKLQLGAQQRKLVERNIPEKILQGLIQQLGDEGLPGCRVEPLLMHFDPTLPPTIGLVMPETALLYWEKITAFGIGAVDFHLAGYTVPDEIVQEVSRILQPTL